MNHYHDLEQNHRSWFAVLQEALPDTNKVQSALHLLKRYCQHHKIKLRIDAGQDFMAVSQPNNHNNKSIAICHSLHHTNLGATCAELAAFINGQTKIDVSTLALKISELATLYTPVERDKIDLMLRQERVLSEPNAKLTLSLFRPQHYPTQQKEIIATALQQATNPALTRTPIELLRAMLAYQLHQSLQWPMGDSLANYYLAELHYLQDARSTPQQLIEVLAAIAWVKQAKQPAFLILSGEADLAIFALMPVQSKIAPYFITVDNHEAVIPALSKLYSAIAALHGMHQTLRKPKHLKLNGHQDPNQAIIAAIAALLHPNTKRQPQSRYVQSIYAKYLSNYGQDLSFASWANQVLRAFSSTKPRKSSNLTAAANNTALSTPNMRQQAAYAMFTLLQQYRPAFYDVFGYDVSRRRNKLIRDLMQLSENDAEWCIYHSQITTLSRARKRSGIYQDLLFGMFIDQVLEDAVIERAQGLRTLHPFLAKLAQASTMAYSEHKQNHALHNIHLLASTVYLDLVRNLYAILCQCASAELARNIEQAVNIWITTEHQIASVLTDPTHQEVFVRELLHIAEELCDTLPYRNFKVDYTNRSTHHAKIEIEAAPIGQLGEFAGLICYQRAHLEITLERKEQDSQALLFPLYNQYLNALPTLIKTSHAKYAQNKKLQIQGKRVLKVLQDYKQFAIRHEHTRRAMYDKLLGLMNDSAIRSAFQGHLDRMVYPEVLPDASVHYKWNWSKDKLLARPEFASFLRHVLAVAKVKPEHSKLHPELLRVIHYGAPHS